MLEAIGHILYLLNQGETFTEQEKQNLFFSITKLLQSNNLELRRMSYLMIKEFKYESAMYIVTSSMIKDISSKIDLFRMNALRTIHLVLDQSNIVQIERYLKNALLDKNQSISSAALISNLHLYTQKIDMVKKWSNEIIDRFNSKNSNNHFHALVLLHELKKQDMNTFTKILLSSIKENYSQLAQIQLVKFIKEVLQQQNLDSTTEKSLVDYLQKQIHKQNEAVVIESCRALCELKYLSNKDLTSAITVLSIFLNSINTIQKFAALKILNKLVSNAIRKPLITNTQDIEQLLTDSNKSLAALAVSLLLKLCKDDNVEKLLNQIADNFSEMSDEFKIDILKSIKNLIKQMPNRAKLFIQFIQNCLKQEGQYEFKKEGVDILELIVNEIPTSKDAALQSLADYIEDCQFNHLQLQCLSILNREASKKAAPAKVIRFINNRIHLEEPEIRAASIAAIGKFGLKYADQRLNILNLLQYPLEDPDEEVRVRAFYNLNLLTDSELENQVQFQQNLADVDVQQLENIEKYVQGNLQQLQTSDDQEILSLKKIEQFAEANKPQFKIAEDVKEENDEEGDNQDNDQKNIFVHATTEELQESIEQYKNLFSEHQLFSSYGQLMNASKPAVVTDPNSEYQVTLHKYFFANNIILEFRVKNTVASNILKNVTLELATDSEDIQIEHIIPASEIKNNAASNILIGLAKNPNQKLVPAKLTGILKYAVEEINASTNQIVTSYNDEMQIDDIIINITDYLFPSVLDKKTTFQSIWENFDVKTITQSFKLNFKNIDIGVKEIVKHFGISICEETDKIKEINKYHTLYLKGSYLKLAKIMIICMIAFDQKFGCLVKFQIKSDDEVLSQNLIDTFNV